MRFCPKCGNLMLVEKKQKRTYLVCKRCKRREMLKERITITEVIPKEKKEVVVLRKKEEMEELPRTKVICPKCGHGEAYWYMQQTRGADEPPTLFYRCVKCDYNWRSYG